MLSHYVLVVPGISGFEGCDIPVLVIFINIKMNINLEQDNPTRVIIRNPSKAMYGGTCLPILV